MIKLLNIKLDHNSRIMYTTNSPTAFEKSNQVDTKKIPKFFDEVTKTNTMSLRKALEISNVLRKIRIKKELEATCNSPNSKPQSHDLGYYSNGILIN